MRFSTFIFYFFSGVIITMTWPYNSIPPYHLSHHAPNGYPGHFPLNYYGRKKLLISAVLCELKIPTFPAVLFYELLFTFSFVRFSKKTAT